MLYRAEEAADRAGVEAEYLRQLVEVGILPARDGDEYSAADVRRVLMIKALEDAGIPREGLAPSPRAARSTSTSSTAPPTSGSRGERRRHSGR